MKVFVVETRYITVDVDTTDKVKACEFAKLAYEDNKDDNKAFTVESVNCEVDDGCSGAVPQVYLTSEGELDYEKTFGARA